MHEGGGGGKEKKETFTETDEKCFQIPYELKIFIEKVRPAYKDIQSRIPAKSPNPSDVVWDYIVADLLVLILSHCNLTSLFITVKEKNGPKWWPDRMTIPRVTLVLCKVKSKLFVQTLA